MISDDDLLREMMDHRALTAQISLDVARLAESSVHHSKTTRLLVYALIAIAAGEKVLSAVLPGAA